MRAELDDRVDFLPAREPEMERDIGVARRKDGVVIVALARERVAPVGLNGDDELAEPDEAKLERPVDDIAIVAGSPHAANKRSPEVGRSRRERGFVFGQRQRRLERRLRQEPAISAAPSRRQARVVARGAQSVR